MELKRKVLYKAIEAGIMTAPTCIYASYAYIQIRTRKLVQEINSILIIYIHYILILFNCQYIFDIF